MARPDLGPDDPVPQVPDPSEPTSDELECQREHVRFPCLDDIRQITKMGTEPAMATGPCVHLYLLDVAINHDPLYGEPDLQYGRGTPDEHIVGEAGQAWDGPYRLTAIMEFQEVGPGGTTPEPSERGSKIRVLGVAKLPRPELERIKMVGAPSEEAVRLPSEGDVLEYAGPLNREDPNGVGPWYFQVTNASFGDQVVMSNFWTYLQLDLELVTTFDPARMVKQVPTVAHTVEIDPFRIIGEEGPP